MLYQVEVITPVLTQNYLFDDKYDAVAFSILVNKTLGKIVKTGVYSVGEVYNLAGAYEVFKLYQDAVGIALDILDNEENDKK